MKLKNGIETQDFSTIVLAVTGPYKSPCQLCFVSMGQRLLDSQDNAIGNDGYEDGVPRDINELVKRTSTRNTIIAMHANAIYRVGHSKLLTSDQIINLKK